MPRFDPLMIGKENVGKKEGGCQSELK